MENNFDILEFNDGHNYIIFDKATINGIDYYYLINELDENDIMIQRTKLENDIPTISNLESEEEFNSVMSFFGKKYKELLESI